MNINMSESETLVWTNQGCRWYLGGRAGFTVVVALLTVVKCIVGSEPAQANGAGLSLGL